MGVVFTPFSVKSRFGSKKIVTASLKEKVFAKDTKNVVKTLSWNLGFGALAAAGAQFTQFREIPEKVKNGSPKQHVWEVQGADCAIFGGAGLILAVIWEACFQRVRQTESRKGGGPRGTSETS